MFWKDSYTFIIQWCKQWVLQCVMWFSVLVVFYYNNCFVHCKKKITMKMSLKFCTHRRQIIHYRFYLCIHKKTNWILDFIFFSYEIHEVFIEDTPLQKYIKAVRNIQYNNIELAGWFDCVKLHLQRAFCVKCILHFAPTTDKGDESLFSLDQILFTKFAYFIAT